VSVTDEKLRAHITVGKRAQRAIEAEFTFAIFDATKRAYLQFRGLEPPPKPSREALAVYERVQERGR
jgi:hypothetical protein